MVLSMRQSIQLQPKLTQSMQLYPDMLQGLDFLKYDALTLHEMVSHIIQSNPFVEETTTLTNNMVDYDTIESPNTIKQKLYTQLYTIDKPYQETILSYLIESLDCHGFLSDTVTFYRQDLNIDEITLNYHIALLQSLEPSGVGAFNSIDSIQIQLLHKGYDLAYRVLHEKKDWVLQQQKDRLAKFFKISQEQVAAIYKQIQSCSPYPCVSLDPTPTIYKQPEIEILVYDGRIELQPLFTSPFIINSELFLQVKNNPMMKSYFQQANFFLDAITKRNQTIILIMDALTKIQEGYFLFQDERKPCTMKQVASLCQYHPSTISRAIHQKYYLWQNQIHPIKDLFISKTNAGDSSDAIKNALVHYIHHENKANPLSDQQLVHKLSDIDLICSRRTVALYRQELHIPASTKRKKA